MAETTAERNARLARERTAKAERDTRNSEAAARSAEAEAKRVAAEASARVEAARIEGERQQRAANERREEADRQERERVRTEKAAADKAKREADQAKAREALPWQVAASVAALPLGIATGVVGAKLIDSRHQAAIAGRSKELAALGKDAGKLLAKVPDKGAIPRALKANLGGVVVAADKLGLGRLKGPVGMVPAALLLAEAAYTRFAGAPLVDDERIKAGLNGIATASVFAATNLVGERMVQNATPKALPSATALAKIEAARNIVSPSAMKAVTTNAMSTAAKIAPLAVKAIPWVGMAVAAGYSAYQGYQQEGMKGAAIGAVDGLTFGAVSAGRAYLNSSAEQKASAAPVSAPIASAPMPSAGSPGGDGGSKSYTTVDGRSVQGTAAQVAAWEKQKGR